MLSTRSLLKNDRYRLDQLISAGPNAHLYKAFDNLLKQPIVILKNDAPSITDRGPASGTLFNLQHDGLMRIADHFYEGSSSFSVTEPLSDIADPKMRSAEALFGRLRVILLAISTLRSEFPDILGLEISPQTFFTTADRKLKLLLTYPAEVVKIADPVNSPYLPLEKVWDELDHINQKAIYRTYDERALAILESPADERSDLYSLGAVFYKLLTGTDPLSAFERSIDMLDTRVDPIVPPRKLNQEISAENSDFVVRLLELRRERRFGSTEDAIFSLPPDPKAAQEFPADKVSDEVDVLEIPTFIESEVKISAPAPSPAVFATSQASATEDPETVRVGQTLKSSAFDVPAAKKPIFIEMVTEPQTGITVEAVPEPVIEKTEPLPIPHSDEDIFFAKAFQEVEPEATFRRKRSSAKLAILAAAAVIVIAAGGWGVFTFNTSKTSVIEPPTAVMSESPKASDASPQALSEPIPQPTAAAEIESVPPPETTAKTTVGPTETKPRPQIAETRSAKPQDKKPVEAKPKKKLTVDDLINDN